MWDIRALIHLSSFLQNTGIHFLIIMEIYIYNKPVYILEEKDLRKYKFKDFYFEKLLYFYIVKNNQNVDNVKKYCDTIPNNDWKLQREILPLLIYSFGELHVILKGKCLFYLRYINHIVKAVETVVFYTDFELSSWFLWIFHVIQLSNNITLQRLCLGKRCSCQLTRVLQLTLLYKSIT